MLVIWAMKVCVKFNLSKHSPDAVTVESDDIDTITTVLRGIFRMTGALVVAESDENLVWIQGPEESILVAPHVKENKDD